MPCASHSSAERVRAPLDNMKKLSGRLHQQKGHEPIGVSRGKTDAC